MGDSRALTIPRETANDDFVILISWLVQDGARVTAGTPVALFETSKATVELVAPVDGYLLHAAAESAELPVGAEIGSVRVSADAAPSPTPAARPLTDTVDTAP